MSRARGADLKESYMKSHQSLYRRRVSPEDQEQKNDSVTNVKEDKLIQNDLLPFAHRARGNL